MGAAIPHRRSVSGTERLAGLPAPPVCEPAPLGATIPQKRTMSATTGWAGLHILPAYGPAASRAAIPHTCTVWLQLTVCLWGMAALDGAGSEAGGTGSLAQLVGAAYGAPVGDGTL